MSEITMVQVPWNNIIIRPFCEDDLLVYVYLYVKLSPHTG